MGVTGPELTSASTGNTNTYTMPPPPPRCRIRCRHHGCPNCRSWPCQTHTFLAGTTGSYKECDPPIDWTARAQCPCCPAYSWSKSMNLNVIPDRYRKLHERALAGKSLRASIHAHCMMCVGWEYEAARDCTDPTCPLYPHRPGAPTPETRRRKPTMRSGAA